MSPMRSADRCMNTRLYAGTDRPCDGPSYWTAKPLLRLCAECYRARFGEDPQQDNLTPGGRRAASDPCSAASPIHAQGTTNAGRDGGSPAPNLRAAA